MHQKLVTKVNFIGTSGFALKTQYNTDKSGLEKKMNDAEKKTPDTSRTVKKQTIILKQLRLKIKKASIAGLATAAAFNTVEYKEHNVSNLVK